MNTDSLKFFERMAHQSDLSPESVKLKGKKSASTIEFDVQLLLQFCSPTTEILDLGSGTGLIVNQIYDKVRSIDAVESFPEFTQYIVKDKRVRIHNENMFSFAPGKQYDLILAFGTMHYFNLDEAARIYAKYQPFLRPGGKFIIKNQFGVNEDVTVQGYSEELKQNYFAQYRSLETETAILKQAGFSHFEIVDIYPPEFNRWQNTHFYALIAEQNNQ